MNGNIMWLKGKSALDVFSDFQRAGCLSGLDIAVVANAQFMPGERVPDDRFDQNVLHVVMTDEQAAGYVEKAERLEEMVEEAMSDGIKVYCDPLAAGKGHLDAYREKGIPTVEAGQDHPVVALLRDMADMLREGWKKYIIPTGPATCPMSLESGRLAVSDPCYKKETWCAAWGLRAKKGDWTAMAWKRDEPFGAPDGWPDIRCAMLEISHDDVGTDHLPWERTAFDIGVDSGQAGFFDIEKYHGGEKNKSWYDACSFSMLPGDRNRLLRRVDGGIVSNSGHGDGGYTLFIKRKDHEIVHAAIVYLPIGLESDDGDDEYYDEDPDTVRESCFGGKQG